MGASDGPVFAPPRPGSRPIVSPPCRCPECVAGPGLIPERFRAEREDRLLGPVNKVVTYDFCRECGDSVITTSVRFGPTWHNTCKHGHSWQSFD